MYEELGEPALWAAFVTHPVFERAFVTFFVVLGVAVIFRFYLRHYTKKPKRLRGCFYLALPLTSLNAVPIAWHAFRWQSVFSSGDIIVAHPPLPWEPLHLCLFALFWAFFLTFGVRIEALEKTVQLDDTMQLLLRGLAVFAVGSAFFTTYTLLTIGRLIS